MIMSGNTTPTTTKNNKTKQKLSRKHTHARTHASTHNTDVFTLLEVFLYWQRHRLLANFDPAPQP